MPHIPDELIIGRIKNRMYGDGELNHTQASAQMSACDRDGVDDFRPNFIG